MALLQQSVNHVRHQDSQRTIDKLRAELQARGTREKEILSELHSLRGKLGLKSKRVHYVYILDI